MNIVKIYFILFIITSFILSDADLRLHKCITNWIFIKFFNPFNCIVSKIIYIYYSFKHEQRFIIHSLILWDSLGAFDHLLYYFYWS